MKGLLAVMGKGDRQGLVLHGATCGHSLNFPQKPGDESSISHVLLGEQVSCAWSKLVHGPLKDFGRWKQTALLEMKLTHQIAAQSKPIWFPLRVSTCSMVKKPIDGHGPVNLISSATYKGFLLGNYDHGVGSFDHGTHELHEYSPAD